MVVRSILLFVLAAVAEIGGAWLVWQGVREQRGWLWAGLGVIALGVYGFFATLQPDAHFGRVLAAYGGVFVAGSLAWGMALDGFRPDRWDVIGALGCMAGVAVIMYAPRLAATDCCGAPDLIATCIVDVRSGLPCKASDTACAPDANIVARRCDRP